MRKKIGFNYIAISSEIAPLIKIISCGDTTVLDAYLAPMLYRYLEQVKMELPGVPVYFMQSNGGLIDAPNFRAKSSILSGPAGGIIGAQKTTGREGIAKIISFDMGGTSTDVAHYKGIYEKTYETVVDGIRLCAPMLAIETIAAGGGSILKFEQDRLQVGPKSAGAKPGPASYGCGGPLTITDANLLLGRIIPEQFPKVFGENGKAALDKAIITQKFEVMTNRVNKDQSSVKTIEEVGEGFLEIAAVNMANAIKKISIQRGYNLANYVLTCFGGAGGQIVCEVAEKLDIKKIYIHKYAGVLSALGMGLADIVRFETYSINLPLTKAFQNLPSKLNEMKNKLIASISQPNKTEILVKYIVHLKYQNNNIVLACPYQKDITQLEKIFASKYQQRFGFIYANSQLEVEMITTELIELSSLALLNKTKDQATYTENDTETDGTISVYINGYWVSAELYDFEKIRVNQIVSGPALIIMETSTVLLKPFWSAKTTENEGILLSYTNQKYLSKNCNIGIEKVDPLYLEIFNNKFMMIAEEMGEILSQSAYSVNIKERKDYSCALFDENGDLVANAPHMPVHLGSMTASIKALVNAKDIYCKPEDAFILNDPYNGGTHLPDLTIISPVFISGQLKPVFYVASRGHHADIGGISPGSMPAFSDHINQEGILFKLSKVVEEGVFKTDWLKKKLSQKPYPARNIAQNIMDIQAQLAANQKGTKSIFALVTEYSYPIIKAYMKFIQLNAEKVVKERILSLNDGFAKTTMDNGAVICVKIVIDKLSQKLTVDFSGTSTQAKHNYHAPSAITKAAVLYVFRCLVKENIPLNEGCLKPITIINPKSCMLNPKYPAAVVAGNVETSQVVVNTLFAALNVLAHAQGTMNNFTFGNNNYQYYETIAGGMGAGDGFAGVDAIQTHMTNSSLTDPEILEYYYPIMLNKFMLRLGSGGVGKYSGGNGVIRQFTAKETLDANILSNNRKNNPQGIKGGGKGKSGVNTLIRGDGTKIDLAASDEVTLNVGDSIIIKTPGGGGYGF